MDLRDRVDEVNSYWSGTSCAVLFGGFDVLDLLPCRIDDDVAYRIYLGFGDKPVVVCVQEFDIADYYNAWMKAPDGKVIQLLVEDYYRLMKSPDLNVEEFIQSWLDKNMDEAMRQFEWYKDRRN